ncbi:hypothetical protein FJW06_26165, partial [Mesorhizobium sp. B4-1-3]|uniref:hypothetical protein n=1 Tax=Mesorhizobium sp. B4-1-3 TaxID=2589889 RepID=UPI001127FD82
MRETVRLLRPHCGLETVFLLSGGLKVPLECEVFRLPWEECLMKTRAAVAVGAGKPLEIMEV